MLTEEAEQRRRRVLAAWMCICIVWVSFIYSHQMQNVQQQKTPARIFSKNPWRKTEIQSGFRSSF